jgi:hypothetical protein
MKVDPPTKSADISLSEDDLMKLKKINFKKKVTGKSDKSYPHMYSNANFMSDFYRKGEEIEAKQEIVPHAHSKKCNCCFERIAWSVN